MLFKPDCPTADFDGGGLLRDRILNLQFYLSTIESEYYYYWLLISNSLAIPPTAQVILFFFRSKPAIFVLWIDVAS